MRIRTAVFLFVFCAAAMLAGTARAGGIADAIQKRYDSLTSIRADFQQELTNAASGSVERRSGRIWFKLPQQVRWDTQRPERELLVVGPRVVWDYFAADKVAMKYRANQVFNAKTKSILKLLSGKANLARDFKVQEMGREGGLTKLSLIPRQPDTTMVKAYLWVDGSAMVRRVRILDFYGNGNQVSLSNIALDRKLERRLFTFAPPAGVKVRDNTRQR